MSDSFDITHERKLESNGDCAAAGVSEVRRMDCFMRRRPQASGISGMRQLTTDQFSIVPVDGATAAVEKYGTSTHLASSSKQKLITGRDKSMSGWGF
jgi:hypothetical protein